MVLHVKFEFHSNRDTLTYFTAKNRSKSFICIHGLKNHIEGSDFGTHTYIVSVLIPTDFCHGWAIFGPLAAKKQTNKHLKGVLLELPASEKFSGLFCTCCEISYSTSLGCRRQPSLACHAWNHGKSPKSSPLSQQCRFHCHTWSAGESHYCVNSNGFMKFGTHTNEESDEYQQKWLPLSDFVGLCSKYIAIPYGSMAFILKKPSFQITRCF